jgi:hypothetical protein
VEVSGKYLTFRNLEKVGRLGNQLWQIASTIGLARRHGMEPRFPPGWSYRKWFSIPDEMFSHVHMDERTRIYMQDLSFIAEVEGEVRSYFRPSVDALEYLRKTQPLPSPMVVVHVRRGDNVNQQDCYPLPSIEYYVQAVLRHLGYGVVLFGDDFEWNRSVLAPILRMTGASVHVVKGLPRPKEHETSYMTAPIFDWVDLFSMVAGTAFCLSNSTLGWWSAWLSGSDDVCYPSPWYGPALDIRQQGYIDGSLMMPPEWQKDSTDRRRQEPRRYQYPVG